MERVILPPAQGIDGDCVVAAWAKFAEARRLTREATELIDAQQVSPARVQQLLAELGSSVSSQPDPNQRRGKLWVLAGSGNGAGAGDS